MQAIIATFVFCGSDSGLTGVDGWLAFRDIRQACLSKAGDQQYGQSQDNNINGAAILAEFLVAAAVIIG